MPELPEVEFARQQLSHWLSRSRVAAVEAPASRLLGRALPQSIERALSGRRFIRADRHGKALFLIFDDDVALSLHLGMSGRFLLDEEALHTRLVLQTDRGRVIRFVDPRGFGAIGIESARGIPDQIRSRLGPDPWLEDISGPRLSALFARTGRPIKVALLDQARLAGVGNIQAAEALWWAELDPERSANALTPEEMRKLAKALKRTLKDTLVSLGASLDPSQLPKAIRSNVRYRQDRKGEEEPSSFKVYGRAGEVCPRCRQDEIARVVHAGRSTYYCPTCQKPARKR